MTPEELKDKWRKLDNVNSSADNNSPHRRDPMIDGVISGRITSARDRLIKRYRMMALVIAPLGIVCTCFQHGKLPTWGIILIVLFFLLAAVMDLYLSHGISSIDPSTQGVDQVARAAGYYKRRHHLFQAILIPMAIGIISLYFMAYQADQYMVWGLIAGIGVGLIAGLAVYFEMMRDYRDMT